MTIKTLTYLIALGSATLLLGQSTKQQDVLCAVLSDSTINAKLETHLDLDRAPITLNTQSGILVFDGTKFIQNIDAVTDYLIDLLSFKTLNGNQYKVNFSIGDELIVKAKLEDVEGQKPRLIKRGIKSTGWILKKNSHRYVETDF